VVRVAAGFRDHVDGGAGEAAVLGLGAKGYHADFLNGVVVHIDEGAKGSGLRIGRVDAVDEKHVLIGELPYAVGL
jgi:hypothetical protein